jgi:DNA topoisomerase IB
VAEVSAYLHNTPAVCRSSYIDPRVFDRFDAGQTIARALARLGDEPDLSRPSNRAAVERAVLRLLNDRRSGG